MDWALALTHSGSNTPKLLSARRSQALQLDALLQECSCSCVHLFSKGAEWQVGWRLPLLSLSENTPPGKGAHLAMEPGPGTWEGLAASGRHPPGLLHICFSCKPARFTACPLPTIRALWGSHGSTRHGRDPDKSAAPANCESHSRSHTGTSSVLMNQSFLLRELQ